MYFLEDTRRFFELLSPVLLLLSLTVLLLSLNFQVVQRFDTVQVRLFLWNSIYEKFYCMSFVPIRNTLLYILGKLDQVGHKGAGEFDLPRNMSLLVKVDYLPVEFFASSAYRFPFEGLFDFRSFSFGIAVVVHYAVLLRVNLNVFVAAVQYDVALLRWPQQ
ncbi:hypothetical protein LAZ67_13001219 [Cordylochernes scorpioides]|uniref:Uncharacterized protein n=1 Tax=Cordylochernes scorpioides TaxID=51811 RepID=A0ABY6L6B9_9ARAC|nr:hypothetical protein LAZ67_13001219 [Cordylochernes scorpioides]